MAKRKAKDLESGVSDKTPRRSSRRRIAPEANTSNGEHVKPIDDAAPKDTKKSTQTTKKVNVKSVKEEEGSQSEEETVAKKPKAPKKSSKPASQTKTEAKSQPSVKQEESKKDDVATPTGRQYWLMKAEPETRLENGHDVRFSIDDLAAKTEPEPWDGIRAYAARNNLRAMKKGDLAFFYHSNCKTPAIVGVMEIVAEHTPDLSAHDPTRPYHDPSSTPDNPKWSVVHVTFRQKLATPITLREMKEWQKEDGHALQEMQMLRLTRMSVSKVSGEEWDFLVAEMGRRGDVIDL